MKTLISENSTRCWPERVTDHGSTKRDSKSPREIEAWIYHNRQVPMCRLCKEATDPITAGCKMLAYIPCMKHYNQVAGMVYRNIYTKSGMETPRSMWDAPPVLMEKRLWDDAD